MTPPEDVIFCSLSRLAMSTRRSDCYCPQTAHAPDQVNPKRRSPTGSASLFPVGQDFRGAWAVRHGTTENGVP